MIISRLSRNTKSSASFKNEIIKRDFERFKKMIKDKTFLSSRSSRRDFENVETQSKSQRFDFDSNSSIIFASFITSALSIISASSIISVSSIIFVFSIIFALSNSVTNSIFDEMNRNVLIHLLTTLISSFAESSNVFVVDIIANSSSIRISTLLIEFVVIIAKKSTTFDEFSNFDEFFAKKEERRRNFLQKMKSHEQRRIIDDFSVFVSNSTRDSLFFVTRVTTSFRNVIVFFFRTSKTSRRRNVVETKSDESFIDRLVIEEKNDDELTDENDDELSNCIKCCRVSMSCRRVIDIACAKCFKQKQTCISICFRFAFFEDFLLITLNSYSI
jgi:hypothetical protein